MKTALRDYKLPVRPAILGIAACLDEAPAELTAKMFATG